MGCKQLWLLQMTILITLTCSIIIGHVINEVRTTMGTRSRLGQPGPSTVFNRHTTRARRMVLGGTTGGGAKFQKDLKVFMYMGIDAPSSFTKTSDSIILSGLLPPICTSATETEVRHEIGETLRNSLEGGLGLKDSDFEFIRVSGKKASVIAVKPGFIWSGNALKTAAGQGSVYIRLTKDVKSYMSSSSSDESSFPVIKLSKPSSSDCDEIAETNLDADSPATEVTHISPTPNCFSHLSTSIDRIPLDNTASHISTDNHASDVPQNNHVSSIPLGNCASRVPRDNPVSPIPQGNRASRVPRDNPVSPIPPGNRASRVPRDNSVSSIPPANCAFRVPRDNPIPPSNRASHVPRDNPVSPLPPGNRASRVPRDNPVSPIPPGNRASRVPRDNPVSPIPPGNRASRVPRDNSVSSIPTANCASRVPQDNPVPPSNRASRAPRDNPVSPLPPGNHASRVPRDNPVSPIPPVNRASRVPRGNSVSPIPQGNRASRVPRENPVSPIPPVNRASCVPRDNPVSPIPPGNCASRVPWDNTVSPIPPGNRASRVPHISTPDDHVSIEHASSVSTLCRSTYAEHSSHGLTRVQRVSTLNVSNQDECIFIDSDGDEEIMPRIPQVCSQNDLNQLFPQFSPTAIEFIFPGLTCEFSEALDIFVNGVRALDIIKLMRRKFVDYSRERTIRIASDTMWNSGIAFYKNEGRNLDQVINIAFQGSMVIDAGGPRRQFFTSMFEDFRNNHHVQLFDGESNYIRPVCSPAICLSGLFTLLGRMVVHSILLEDIGFPYLAPFVYWYIAVGDSSALDHLTMNDFGDNVKDAMHKVGGKFYENK